MRKIVVANWKMNPPSLKEAKELFAGVKRAEKKARKAQVIICPPFVYLSLLAARGGGINLGAQDVFYERKGAFTGEIAPSMVRDVGANYVIVGHSERRKLGEDNTTVNRKIKAALAENLRVIFCIGELVRDIHGRYFNFLEEELLEGLKGVSRNMLKNIIIAYEPIWAIGKNADEAMKPEDMHQMSIFVKKVLVKRFDKRTALSIPILYGGSVEPENAGALLKYGEADGFLVGHASLDIDDFKEILKIAHNVK